MTYRWLSTERMTVARVTPPVVRRFIGQPFANLVRWMRQQSGFVLA